MWRSLRLPARAGLADERAGFFEAIERPIGAAPLRGRIGPDESVAIAIPDITRPFPSARVLPWLLEALAHVPDERVVIVNGTGSHRPNTPAEIEAMIGPSVARSLRVVNHRADDPSTLAEAGRGRDGRTVLMNRDYLAADRRIVLGFIEPHFMAGFSGGCKGAFPALGDLDSIMHYHRAAVIGDPASAWGRLEGNPTQAIVRDYGQLAPIDFLVNVTLNAAREITGFYCGDPIAAHEAGCADSARHCMARVERSFPVVVTTNNGWPLDQNLYQAVKGMSAAAMIVEEGGLIVSAAECREGFPDHGNFKRLLFEHDSPEAFLATIEQPGFLVQDQWEAQLLALIRRRARVALKSAMAPEDLRRAWLEPVEDVGARVAEELARLGGDAPVAVLPEGFTVIPQPYAGA